MSNAGRSSPTGRRSAPRASAPRLRCSMPRSTSSRCARSSEPWGPRSTSSRRSGVWNGGIGRGLGARSRRGPDFGVRPSPVGGAGGRWTYRAFGAAGAGRDRQTSRRLPLQSAPRHRRARGLHGNELPPDGRAALLPRLLEAGSQHGARVLVVEPIARTAIPWWDEWAAAFTAVGGEAKEWRFAASLPERQLQLARAAGLDPRELTARSLWL